MKKVLWVTLALALIVFLSACSTSVMIETNVEGAEVSINYRPVGTTPVTIELSNAFWEEYYVDITKEGFRPIHATLKKEVKVGPVIGGLLGLGIPWLYVWGPSPYQFFVLEPLD